MSESTIPPTSSTARPPRVLMPLPRRGFDPTETDAPWKMLKAEGVDVVFATPDGQPGEADPWMLAGGVDVLGPFGPFLIADANGRAAYRKMALSPEFQAPISYADIEPDTDTFDGLVLPGGHAQGMKEYLDSGELQAKVAAFFELRKPIGAICHGVLLAARCRRADGRSVLEGYRTTALTEQMELFAWNLTKAHVGDYYRTYPKTLQREVTELIGQGVFDPGPQLPAALGVPAALGALRALIGNTETSNTLLKTGVFRDRPDFDGPAYTVCHGDHYLSARWPGDAFTFGKRFLALLRGGRC